jgi:asparagine synthase (glutamine-hydrolysing)
VMNEDLIRDLLGNAPEQALESTRACYERAAHLPLLDQILYVNFKTYLSDDLCVKMDRMSMAHSLEARSPFLDTAIVDYVSRIPAAQKIGWRRVKPLLRQAFWPLLPKEIWNRRKHGFGVPLGPWFRSGALRELFEDEVLAPQARCSAYLDQKVLAALWQRHQDGQGEYGAPLWALLTLERWLRSVETSAASSSPAQLNL